MHQREHLHPGTLAWNQDPYSWWCCLFLPRICSCVSLWTFLQPPKIHVTNNPLLSLLWIPVTLLAAWITFQCGKNTQPLTQASHHHSLSNYVCITHDVPGTVSGPGDAAADQGNQMPSFIGSSFCAWMAQSCEARLKHLAPAVHGLCLQQRTLNSHLRFSGTKRGAQHPEDKTSLSLYAAGEDICTSWLILSRKPGCLALPQTACMISDQNQFPSQT